jgi:hypothetical protein
MINMRYRKGEKLVSTLGFRYTVEFNDGTVQTYDRYDARVHDGVLTLNDLGNRYGAQINIPLTSIKFYRAEDV